MKKLSIIIVNWNTKELLEKCLSSIYNYTKNIEFEIIISDNGSNDGSLEMINTKFPSVILVQNGKNLGFGKANNIAFKYCTGEYILFLNSDTEIFDNSIKILYDFINSNSKIGACGGKLLFPDKSLQLSFGYFPSMLRILWITLSGILHIKKNRKPMGVIPYNVMEPMQVDYVVGADLIVRKDVLNEIGLFDEIFFAYFEETDLCFRIKKANYEVWYVPQSEIIHIYGGSFKKFSKQKFEIFTTSQFKYYKKNLGYYRPLKYYFLLDYLMKMLIYYFKNPEKYEEQKNMYSITKKVKI